MRTNRGETSYRGKHIAKEMVLGAKRLDNGNMFCRLESLCMLEWIEAWLQQFIIATTRRNWFRAKQLVTRTSRGEIFTEAKRPGAKRPGGKRRLADRLFQMTSFYATLSNLSICAKRLNGLGRNDSRILDGKIVTRFTHYKVNMC